ncbi:Inner membrane ABC transporter permease protein ycjP [Chlamydia abortus]|uniref:Carbohydrate ABC transporter permease n=1 Tax=Paenibacillus residui TaxID=629724 RepID=A0ABW3DDX5_9BACL|nr:MULTISPECIES: carbohydrate ABC transporter permease [Paenibacillaceae]SHE13292.1 Inner membrane ABC transporter permease protein ycjP [Chlamydia abortus]
MASKSWVSRAGLYAAVIFISFLMIAPVYILVKISFSQPGEVLTQHPTFLIHEVTFKHWKQIFESGNLWPPLRKSFTVASLTMIIAILIVAPASYAISRMGTKAKYGYILTLFFTKMFPIVGIALPISVTFLKWNLLDTDIGLVLAHLIGQLPFMAWILVANFSSIPIELEEAAYVDGATRMQALIRIILPVAMQGIAVAALYVWLNSWNDFTYALYLSLSTKTMPLQIYYYVERGGFFQQAAYATILAIPVFIITFIFQRYLKSDYLGGAVKG